MTIPPGTDVYCGVQVKFDVEGDFEITAGYTIESLPKPEVDSQTGLKLSIRDVDGQQCATVGHWVSRGGVQVFKAGKSVSGVQVFKVGKSASGAHVFEAGKPVTQESGKPIREMRETLTTTLGESPMQKSGRTIHDVQVTLTAATSGKLRLVRTGSMLKYLVAEGPGDEFVEIRTLEFSPTNLSSIDFAAQTGGSLEGIDVVFTDFEIQTENLSVRVGPPSNLLVNLLRIGVGVALVVLVAVGFLWWQKKRSKGQGGEVKAVR